MVFERKCNILVQKDDDSTKVYNITNHDDLQSCKVIQNSYSETAATSVRNGFYEERTETNPEPQLIKSDNTRELDQKYSNLVQTTKTVNEILIKIGYDTNVKEWRRLGKFDRDKTNSRTFLVTFSKKDEASLVLAKSYVKRTELEIESIF